MKNYSIIKTLVVFLATLLPAAAFVGVPVKGVVVDKSGYPLVGVMVYEPGTSSGSMTDIDGNYTLTVSSGKANISFSSMGYLEHTENVAGRSVINVTLQDDTQTLEEVVVVGYGVQKKGTMTGSIASVSTDALTKAPTDNVSNMLGGKLPGLVSRQTSGLPGENQADIYIRGISTTGSSSPLVLVDGVERDFSNLDPSEIANITILKDAASAAVYGVKGANGVILVTTKRGDAAQTTITYNGALTLSQNANRASRWSKLCLLAQPCI